MGNNPICFLNFMLHCKNFAYQLTAISRGQHDPFLPAKKLFLLLHLKGLKIEFPPNR